MRPYCELHVQLLRKQIVREIDRRRSLLVFRGKQRFRGERVAPEQRTHGVGLLRNGFDLVIKGSIASFDVPGERKLEMDAAFLAHDLHLRSVRKRPGLLPRSLPGLERERRMRSSRHRDDPIGACRPVVHELPALDFHETVVNVHEKSVRGKCDLFLEYPSGHRRVFGRTPPVARLVLPVLSPDVMVYGIEGRGADRRKSPLPYVAFVGERTVRMSRKRDGVGVRLERARGISGISSADVRPEASVPRMRVLYVEERFLALQRRAVLCHVRFDFRNALFRNPMRAYERVALDRLFPDRGIRLAEEALPVSGNVVHEYLFGRHFGLGLAHRFDCVVYALRPGAERDVVVSENGQKLDLAPILL